MAKGGMTISSSFDKRLCELGLSEKEARIYVTLLQQGQATAQSLSEHSGVNRATTYAALESLERRALVESTSDEKTTLYAAHEPGRLLHCLHQEEVELEERKQRARLLVPELEMIRGLVHDRPKVRVFHGAHHVPALQKEIRRSEDRIFYSITHVQKAAEVWPAEKNREHRRKLEEEGYRGYTIMVYDPHEPITPAKLSSEECRFLPAGKFPFQIELFLTDGKVLLATISEDMFGVVIDDAAVYESFKVLFDSLWELSGKYATLACATAP